MLFSGEAAARVPCPARPQPLAPALDAVPARAGASETIGFAAEPSLQYPGRAWVVRLSRQGERRASVEILRLLRRSNCNLYDVEKSWGGPIGADEYRAVGGAVAAWAARGPEEIVTDGTGLELRVRGGGSNIRRRLNHYGAGGAELSAIFRRVAARFVPPAQLPAEDWRTRPAATSPAP